MSDTAEEEHVPVDMTSLKLLAFGKSGVVYATGDGRAVKDYFESSADEAIVERKAFARLGSHPNIVRYFGTAANGFAVLERGESLHLLIRDGKLDGVSVDQKCQWAKEAAAGLQHLHSRNMLHADVGCSNIIIVDNHAKLIDFEGCSIDGSEALSGYQWFSCRRIPLVVTVQSDIFAFGCAVYELMAGHCPHHELATEENRVPFQQANARYANNEFPDTAGLPLGETIRACWTDALQSMEEVIDALDREHAAAKVTKSSYATAGG